METMYVIKAIFKDGREEFKKSEAPRVANYHFDKFIADGAEDIEVYGSVTGEPFQKYTITEDEEGDIVESIWTAREFYNLI